ncbi:MAG: hypothetical protein FWG65_06535 [Turicibacter sp.]|nr:hypothetical protein [Turicibacter sp.]
MNDQTKNSPNPAIEPKAAKYKKLIFAIIVGITFAVAIAINESRNANIAWISLISADPETHFIFHEIDVEFCRDGSYIRILPNGETVELRINASVYNHQWQLVPVRMNNHSRIITWQVDNLFPSHIVDSDGENYIIRRNARGLFTINLTDEFREINIKVTSNRNAEVYAAFSIIIDPNMTPTEPPSIANPPKITVG